MHTTEKLLFVDLETTGTSALGDRITEIGIITVEPDGHIDQWSSVVNPGVEISSFIQRLTGISNEMVRGAPAFSELADEVASRLSEGLFIAHNVRFDYSFLHHALVRSGQSFAPEALCTVKLSRQLYPAEKKHSLDTLIDRHGLIPSARHRALADADLLLQLWERFQQALPASIFRQAVTALRHVPRMQMPQELIDEISHAAS